MPKPVKSRRVTLPRLGLRCELMTVTGVLWVLFGAGVLSGVSDPPGELVFAKIPAIIRGVLWVGTGVWAFVAGVVSRGTSRALAALMVMPLLRLVSYGLAWGLVVVPGVQPGEMPGGWFYSGIYAVMVFLVVAMVRIQPGITRDGTFLPRFHRRSAGGETNG